MVPPFFPDKVHVTEDRVDWAQARNKSHTEEKIIEYPDGLKVTTRNITFDSDTNNKSYNKAKTVADGGWAEEGYRQ